MPLSRQTIVEQVFNIVKDTTFNLDPSAYINYALLAISKDRPFIKTFDHLVVADDVLDQGGLQFSLPTGFDTGRDMIKSVELLDRTRNYASLNPPNIIENDHFLYDTETGVTKLRFISNWDEGEKLRIKYQSEYSFDTESGSNVPDSLREPIVLYTAAQYALAIAIKYGQAKTDGLDFINMTENKTTFMELYKNLKEQYENLVKAMPISQDGVVPRSGAEAAIKSGRSLL